MSTSTPELLRVAIVGGGLAGLTTAYELIRLTRIDALPLEIRLYEASTRVGGVIRSERTEGFLVERGPDSFSTDNPAGLMLAVELGVQDQLIPAHVERGLLIWWEDRCLPLPPGPSRLAERKLRGLFYSPLLSARGKVRASMERLVPRRRGHSDESIASFVTRRFGRQMLDRVGEPLLAGFYRGDAKQLGVRYTFPELVELEHRNGSIAKGLRAAARGEDSDTEVFPGVAKKVTRSPIVSFRDGLQTLVDAVADAIHRNDTGALQLGRRVSGLRPAGDPVGAAAYAVETEDGESWIADICVLAVPGRIASSLVKPFAPEVAKGIAAVPYASSLSVHLGYDQRAAQDVPETMGCLVPSIQGRPSLACWIVNRKLDHRAPSGATLLNIQMGDAPKPQLVPWDDRGAAQVARQEAAALFGVQADPMFTEVRRWPKSHPQYLVGHSQNVENVERQLDLHSGLLIAGSALYGSAIPDVIDNGRATARIISDLALTRLV